MSEFYKEFTVTWVIKNFSFWEFEKKGNIICSPSFNAKNIENIVFFIAFCVEEGDDFSGHASLGLCRTLYGLENVTLDLEMELCNSENEVFYTTEKKKGVKFEKGYADCFCKVLPMKELRERLMDTPEDTLILRFRMGATVESASVDNTSDSSCTIKTTYGLDELSYMRQVIYSEDPEWTDKLTFPINKSQQLNVNIEHHQDDILFHISQDDEKLDYFIGIVKCGITLLDDEGVEKVSQCDFFNFTEKLKMWHFPSFLKRSLLKKDLRALDLKFNFTLSNGFEFETKIPQLPSSPIVSHKVAATNFLADDLRQMLFSKELADVSFCVDGEVISAHKFILASRSPVFSAMFQQEMVEKQTGVIEISDMDVKTLKLFLEFLYTGQLQESNWERMLELLLIGEKYQVSSLKVKCSLFFKHRISLDNVCDVVSVADMVGEQTLKEAAMDYIKENAAEVLSSPKWCAFIVKNIKLCSEIFYNFSEDLKAKHTKS